MKKKHCYDALRLKKLVGIEINTKKYNTFSKIKEIILEKDNDSKISYFLRKDDRNQINPNTIIFLKKCGFDLCGISKNNVMSGISFYYDIMNNGKMRKIFW
jgi:hypothetical protein